MAHAIHISPNKPPFPGAAACNATIMPCPFGGMNAHLVTEYLPEPYKTRLIENGEIPDQKIIAFAVAEALGDPKRAHIFAVVGHEYSDIVRKTALRKLMPKAAAQAQGKELQDVQKHLREMETATMLSDAKTVAEHAGKEKSSEMLIQLQTDPQYKEQMNRRKANIYQYSRFLDEHGIRGTTEYNKERTYNRDIPILTASGKTLGQEFLDKAEGAWLVKENQFTSTITVGRNKNAHEETRTVKASDYMRNKTAHQHQVENANYAAQRIGMIMSFGTNPDIRNGNAFGNEYSIVDGDKVVTAKLTYDTPVMSEIEKLPEATRDAISVSVVQDITANDLQEMLDAGDITQEEFNDVTRQITELDVVSIKDMRQAQKDNPLELPDLENAGDINNVEDLGNAVGDVLKAYSKTSRRFTETNPNGYTMTEALAQNDRDAKALKQGIAETYGEGVNVLVAGNKNAVGSNIVQSTKLEALTTNQLQRYFGRDRFEKITNSYAKVVKVPNPKLMKEILTEDQKLSCLGISTKLSERKATKAEMESGEVHKK